MRCGLIYGEEDDRGISELLGVEVSLELLVLPGLVGLRGGLPVLEAAHVVVVVALGQLPVDPVVEGDDQGVLDHVGLGLGVGVVALGDVVEDAAGGPAQLGELLVGGDEGLVGDVVDIGVAHGVESAVVAAAT